MSFEPNVPPPFEEDPLKLTVASHAVIATINILDIAAKAGAFGGSQMAVVGALYNYLLTTIPDDISSHRTDPNLNTE
jgi:hypothetical protein